MNRKIVFAIDYSECSKYAVEWSFLNMKFTSKDIILLVHVLTPPSSVSCLREFNENITSLEESALLDLKRLWNAFEEKFDVFHDIKVEFMVGLGDPCEKLFELVSQGEEDEVMNTTMLIMGTHGLSNRNMGSVSDFCIKKCPCPVIIVKSPNIKT